MTLAASATDAVRSSAPPPDRTRARAASAVLMALFFAIGFLTCLNDIIIPHFKTIFELNYTRAMLIQMSFFTAYFVASAPSGMIIRALGYKRGIVLGLLTAAAGCLAFYPAAALRSYPLFLGALFVLASGFTLLQVAANPYVAILGSAETASSRLTLTQAFNSLGTTIAPLIGSSFILGSSSGMGDVAGASAASVQRPYLVFAAALVAMSLALASFRLPGAAPAAIVPSSRPARARGAWSHPPLVLGVVAIFVYVGAEVAIGSFLVSFLREPSVGGVSEATAARCISIYWGGAMVGRFVGAGLLRRWAPRRVLAAFAALALVLVAVTIGVTGHAAMVAILAVGLFNSIMFPTIFTLAIDGLGDDTGQGSGLLCMAIVGGAIIPVVAGALADRVGIRAAFVVPAFCYAYIAWYGRVGSVLRVAKLESGAWFAWMGRGGNE
jgi:FHS family L-fucose permease-like MFS transporter